MQVLQHEPQNHRNIGWKESLEVTSLKFLLGNRLSLTKPVRLLDISSLSLSKQDQLLQIPLTPLW